VKSRIQQPVESDRTVLPVDRRENVASPLPTWHVGGETSLFRTESFQYTPKTFYF